MHQITSQRVPASLSDLVACSTSRRSGAAGPLPFASWCGSHGHTHSYRHSRSVGLLTHVSGAGQGRLQPDASRERSGFVFRQARLHPSRTAAPSSTRIGRNLRLIKTYDLSPSPPRYIAWFVDGVLLNAEGCSYFSTLSSISTPRSSQTVWSIEVKFREHLRHSAGFNSIPPACLYADPPSIRRLS